MTVDLSKMSRSELVQLRADIEEAITVAETREREEALKAAQEAAAKFGFELSELTGGVKSAATKKTKAAAKYKNPENPSETWSGRGRKPQWLHAALLKGLDLTDLEI